MGVALGDEAASWPLPSLVAALRQASAIGVDVFDLTYARPREAAELALAQAFPPGSPAPVCLVPVGGAVGSRPAMPGRDGLEGTLPWSEDLQRLRRTSLDVAILSDPPEGGLSADPRLRLLASARAASEVRAWGVAWRRSGAAGRGMAQALAEGATVLAAPYHLLDPAALAGIEEMLGAREVSVVVHDPFARGRLDGTLLREGPARTTGIPRVTDMAELHRSFDLVTRLGFLTEGRRRTLPQAALQFALRPACVASVLVPLAPPDILASYAHLEAVPELSDAEWTEWSALFRDRPSPPSTSGAPP